MSAEAAHDAKRGRGVRDNGFFGGIYGMAFLGAAVYFISHASGFWAGVLGFFKAIFWPAFMIYGALELMNL